VDINALTLTYIGAASAMFGGLMGSSIGIAAAGSAATPALSEDPKQFRNVLVLAALPMTQTFYALIFMLLALGMKVDPSDISTGWKILAAGSIVFFAELVSAIMQGKVCASGIALLPRTGGKITFHTLLLAVYVELFGVFGMVFSILFLRM